ncbi:MAG: helix-hairpin-helix domain-containing protein [Chitinophagaceae bacterium]|nr:helix-hairpin-helix domain-containing protein [Chitinophagaceae bacterium]
MKRFIKDYLTFSRKESSIAIIILIIIAIFISLPYYYSYTKSKEPFDSSLAKIADSILAHQESVEVIAQEPKYKKFDFNKSQEYSTTLKPFSFNPNTLDENGLLALGLNPRLVKTILNYRNKGGSFRKPDDFRKIWGLKKEDADVLVPYIILPQQEIKKSFENFTINKSPQLIDINTATIADFRNLPIETTIAYKIFNYREKLGGFIVIEQVKETYGVTDTVYKTILPFLRVNTIALRQININTASEFELSQHPYIDKNLAKAIIYYREKYGSFSTVNDLKKIVFITSSIYQKIAPYLTI